MSRPPRLEAALFDFGGVFTTSPFHAAESVGAELGAAPGRLLELVFGSYAEDTDHPWHRLERGEIAFGEARDAIIALGRAAGLDADPVRVFQKMGTDPGIRPGFVERARRLREAGLRTALVTNNAREFRDRWRALIPTDDLFELVVDSSEVGVRKPDPAIFRIALEGLGDGRPRAGALPRRLRGQRRRRARARPARAPRRAGPGAGPRRARPGARGALSRR